MATSAKSNLFDGLAFVKHMKNIGRSYRKQAMELVSISRNFAQVQEQTSCSDGDLRSVLEVVDEALYSATEAQKKTSKDADKKFKMAIDALSAYETKYHPKKIVAEKMEKAEEGDKSSSKVLNRLKENFIPIKEEPMKTVEFHIHKSLPDRRPTIVTQMLSKTSGLKEIMWNFSHYRDERRLTLKQNPHFYEVLPTLPDEYEGRFRRDPIETFDIKEVNVLTDNSGLGRVILETAKETRAFGNIWVPKRAIIFKDVCGKLEGESIVGADIQDAPNLWWFEEPSPSPTSQSPDRSKPPSTTAPTTSPTLLSGNWTDPIRRMLHSFDVNIRISARTPTTSGPGPGHSTPSSLTLPSLPSGSVSSLSQSRPPTIGKPRAPTTRVSTGSGSPSSYRTAQPTPPPSRPPVADPSPPCLEPSPVLPTHTTPTPASNTAAPAHTTTLQPPIELSPRSPEPHPISTTHSTVIPAPISATPSHGTPLQSSTMVMPLSGPAEPAPVSPEESVVMDPIMSQAERDEVPVAGQNPSKRRDSSRDSGFVSSPMKSSVPAPIVPAPVPTPVPTASAAVTAAVSPPKRSWFQTCIDVVKNGLRIG